MTIDLVQTIERRGEGRAPGPSLITSFSLPKGSLIYPLIKTLSTQKYLRIE